MKNLVIRVDSGLVIGSGHLMRCITLAKNLMKKADLRCIFVARGHQYNFNEVITRNGFKVVLLDKPSTCKNYSAWLGTSQDNDARQTHKALKNNGITKVDILIVDHYALDIQWESQFRQIAKKIVVIDDLANRKHCCDILLDQNMAPHFSTRYDDLIPKGCKKFLGIAYCLLRDDFFTAKVSIKVRERLNNVLIFFGGVDKNNATLSLLHVLEKELGVFRTINVVVGQSNPYKHQIHAFCLRFNNCNYLEQVSNMAEIIALSDIAIGAGGATTGERIFLGLPSIVFSLADNQVEVARYLDENEYITYLGDQREIMTCDIVFELKRYVRFPDLLKERSIKLLTVSESKLSKLIQEIVRF